MDRVEPRCPADELMVVLRALAVLAQRAHARVDLARIGNERACVAEGSEVLGGIEAKGGCRTGRARRVAITCCTVRLARVLEYLEVIAFGQRHECRHVGELAVEMHRK